jgi:hypothetical protein
MAYEYHPPESIAKVGVFLSEPLPEDKTELLSHVRALVAVCYGLDVNISNWMRLLAETKAKMLWPKDKELTELDRKTRLDASVAVIESDYELLIRIEALAKLRLELAIKLSEH